MTTKLAHCLNKTILVSAPEFFGDDQPQPCTLIDIEPSGLWLGGEELAKRIHLGDQRPDWFTTVTLFLPFSQIAYVLDTAQLAGLARDAAVLSARTERPRERPSKKSRAKLRRRKTKTKPAQRRSARSKR